MDNVNRNIIDNSYYLIKKYNDNGKEITNLKLQKLLYFVEAYYMASNSEENELYYEKWCAWNYGPVCYSLYRKYKVFGSSQITLSEAENREAIDISITNKEYIDKIYDTFQDLTARDLVILTHLENSPWYNIKHRIKNEETMEKPDNNNYIDKKETRDWFLKTFVKNSGKK